MTVYKLTVACTSVFHGYMNAVMEPVKTKQAFTCIGLAIIAAYLIHLTGGHTAVWLMTLADIALCSILIKARLT